EGRTGCWVNESARRAAFGERQAVEAMGLDQAMLDVVREIYEGGKDLIRNWKLLEHATDALKKGGPEGLKRYYEHCLSDPKGQWVKETLGRNGRKTLKSEHARFLAIYRSGPGSNSDLLT